MSEPLAFHFETLNVYQLAIGVARWTRTVSWPPNTKSLQDQATRATDSIVLNLCEGLSRKGRTGANQLRIARASAAEAFAALDILPDVDESRQRRTDLRRISALIAGLQRS